MRRFAAGFSLIELAIVMVIIAALVSGAIIPLTASIDRTRVTEARDQLDQRIRMAILGYAASRPPGSVYLPCPDCRSGCATPNDGVEDRNGDDCAVRVGNLPWVTLGLGDSDPWGSRYGYAIQPTFASAAPGFTLNTPDLSGVSTDLIVRDRPGGAALIGTDEGAVAVIWSAGKNGFGAMTAQGVARPAPPAANAGELENFNGYAAPTSPDVEYVSRPIDFEGNVEQFDDVVIWLSAPEVRGFMVQAGKLP